MTDEARIARLTEIARQVPAWAELSGKITLEVRPYHWPEAVIVYAPLGGAAETTLLKVNHPRALDALEAALLVLADEERIPLTERRVFEDRIEALERDRATLVRRYKDRELEQTAWVEQLAQEWEASAVAIARRVAQCLPGNEYASLLTDMLTQVIDGLARELRERAKRVSDE